MPDLPSAPHLYLIASRESTGGTDGRLLETVGRVLDALERLHVDPSRVAVQLREKNMEAHALLELARPLRDLTARAGVALYVNDRVDVALAVQADGVHLSGGSLSVPDATAVAPQLSLALSTHSPDELALAQQWRATGQAPGLRFAVFGPIFDTPSKRAFGPPQGTEALGRAVEAAGDLPVLALGGVDASRDKLAAIRATGAAGVACIRAMWESAAPDTTLATLATLLDL